MSNDMGRRIVGCVANCTHGTGVFSLALKFGNFLFDALALHETLLS
jgi:hypothetical protein